MNLLRKQSWLPSLFISLLFFCCQSTGGKATADQAAIEPDDAPTPMPVSTRSIAGSPTPGIDCSQLLSASMIESICGIAAIKERVTSVERPSKNCNRSYGMDKAWGDELIFITTPVSDGTRSFDAMKKSNQSNGLSEIDNIGEAAFSLRFKDKLTGRQQEQLVFLKNNLIVELKTQQSRSPKTPCPCYDAEKLKKLAAAIAAKIQ